ncbi:hypothetical protein TCAL_02029 [Tigriopus californicus]|nr:hypothetical protein TCAL_02029 [Tigriopus californicus]|eukprot:TCALIF_02029-PA protein Name:"Similar to Actin (Cyanidioschyzon merolae)" AED:0.47 eAED:0.47 QI:0/-1/0/1/-1/1/1/0/1433
MSDLDISSAISSHRHHRRRRSKSPTPETEGSESSKSSKRRSSSSSKRTPKSILKNSNPHAPYKSEPQTIEELVERERPRSTSSGSHHRHHKSSKSGDSDTGSTHRHKTRRRKEGSVEDVRDEEVSGRKSHHRHHGSRSKSSGSHHHKSGGDSGGEDTIARRHHRRHHKRAASSPSSADQPEVAESFDTVDGPTDNDKSNDRSHESALHANIYDQPKVPAVKCSSNQRDSPERHGEREVDSNTYTKEEVNRIYKAIVKAAEHSSKAGDSFEPTFYENVSTKSSSGSHSALITDDSQLTHGYTKGLGKVCGDDDVLYDVPRSKQKVARKLLPEEIDEFRNKCDDRKIDSLDDEAIYQNDGIGLENYDIPRRNQVEELSDFMSQEYDTPKIRDSLSTIEEEHQDYDIPKQSFVQTRTEVPSPLNGDGSSGRGSAEDLYENQTYSVPKHNSSSTQSHSTNMYPNEKNHHYCDFSSQNDDRSSGYRSSSSPSIQSEELYVNESAIASMEDLDSVGSSHKHSSPEPISSTPQVRDIAIETTLERHVDHKKPRSDTIGRREMAREKERAKAEEIEREIRRKREEAAQKAAAAQQKTPQHQSSNHPQDPSPSSEETVEHGVNFEEFDFDEVEKRNYGPRKVEPPMPPPPPPATIAVHKQSKTMLKLEREHATEIANNFNEGLKIPSKFVPIVNSQKFQQERMTKKPSSVFSSSESDREEPIRRLQSTLSSSLSSPIKKTSSSDVHPVQSDSNDKTAERKRQQQRDRSVDVYHETVRQRATSSRPMAEKILSKDMFSPPVASMASPIQKSVVHAESQPLVMDFAAVSTIKKSQKKTRAPIRPTEPAPPPPKPVCDSSSPKSSSSPPLALTPTDATDEDDMPSVRQLRSKFELDGEGVEDQNQSGSLGSNGLSSPKKSFLVMASLTRRGAVMMSKTLQQKEEKYRKQQQQQQQNHHHGQHDADIKAQSLNKSIQGGNNGSPISGSHPGLNEHAEKLGLVNSHDQNRATFRLANVPADSLNSELLGKQDREEVVLNGHWNPVAIVNRLYQMLQVDDNEVEKNSADAAHIEGFLERLPTGKKKSTIWNSWKKQYFVAKKGILYSYADDTCSSPLEVLELFGGKVEYIDSKMLGVHDRRGHYLAVRCPSDKQALKWETAINAHINQDFSKTFVTPSPIPKSLSYYTQILVVDIGGASVRAGVASKVPSLPQLFFPCVMAVDHHQECSKYFGMDAFAKEIRSRSKLSHPMVPTHNVDKYTVDQTALQGIFEKIFKDLALEPNDFEIQLSVPRSFNERTKHSIAGMLFEEFGVRSVNMAHQTTFAFYAYNAKSGIMVDLGERMDIVPIVDGYKLQAGVSRSPVGGKELRSKLQHYLLGRNYSLTSFIDSYVTRFAIENLAYMSRNFDLELEKYSDDPETIDASIEVAPGHCHDAPVRTLEIGSERFEA